MLTIRNCMIISSSLLILAVKYGDDKPLETGTGRMSWQHYGSGQAAMVLGQGAWIEADSLAIDPRSSDWIRMDIR